MELLEWLSEPLAMVARPSERIYLGFLFSSAALALGWALVTHCKAPLRRAFAPQLWGHRSSWLDVQFLFVRVFTHSLVFAPLLVQAVTASAVVAALLEIVFGRNAAVPTNSTWVTAGYTISLFLAHETTRYWLHRAMHRVPRLWAIHQVHHSAQVLTPLTLYRIHPVESLLYGYRAALTTGIVTGGFYYCFGAGLDQWNILGVNALGFVFNALGANLRHSHVPLSFGRSAEGYFISPAQHQLHHSRDPAHWGSNFGSFLALWDRLGGTLLKAPDAGDLGELSYGLRDEDANHRATLWSALSRPVAGLFALRSR